MNARNRREKSESPEPERLLTARETKLDLESGLNKTVVVQGSIEPGFYCPDCNITLKDSVSYLDHINGRQHLKKIGTSMVVERSTLAQVKARFELLRQKSIEQVIEYDLEHNVLLGKAEERAERGRKREDAKARKKAKSDLESKAQLALQDHDVAKLMGFGAFGK